MYDKDKCSHCHRCQNNCPASAIHMDPYNWDKEVCVHCQTCVQHCLASALSFNGKRMSIEEVVTEVLKDKDYYDESQGGVTISGGEPFFQFDSFLELLKALKKEGLHVAIETTGNYPLEQLKQALPYIDLFLFDIKHLDAQKLMEVTKGHLDWIVRNYEYICQTRSKDIITRMPVIPGFNDDIIEDVIAFSKEHDVQAVNLLPYHSMGKKKWHELNQTYIYEDEEMMDKSLLSQYASSFVKVGG